jgi:hypothetical protein
MDAPPRYSVSPLPSSETAPARPPGAAAPFSWQLANVVAWLRRRRAAAAERESLAREIQEAEEVSQS